jgi:hypothetical protein
VRKTRRAAQLAIVSGFLALLASGCVYTNIQIPLDQNYDRTQLGTKVGQASSQSLLWLFAWGDGGTRAAADNGGITTIQHADRRFFSLLFGAYTRVTTILYGE